MPDGRFLIVYRLDSGHYSKPVSLTKSDAIDVARRFQEETRGDKDRKVNLAAASYVYEHVRKHGWLDVRDDSVDTESDSSVVVPASGGGPTRMYLPFLAASKPADVTEEVIDNLAFVLSGVNPAKRIDLQTAKIGTNLTELYAQPNARLSSGSTLFEDHWYVLAHLHQLPSGEFRELWQAANDQFAGQEATDLLKASRKLQKFKLDNGGNALKDPNNRELLIELKTNSVDLLYRQYRSARRKLDELHSQSSTAGKRSSSRSGRWLTMLGVDRFRGKPVPETVPVTEAEREIVTKYVDAATKLGRILRSDVVQRSI